MNDNAQPTPPALNPTQERQSKPPASTAPHPSLRPSSTPTVPIRSKGMLGLLDQLLRDRDTLIDGIFEGKTVIAQLRSFFLATLLLAGFYGLSMGLMGFRHSWDVGLLQMGASAIKVPLLFLLSTVICFPVLYIVQVLMGARLAFTQTLALLLMALTLNSILLASCAPIAFFFVVTGSTHDFIKLLHVAIFAFAGLWSMMSLWLGLRTMCEKSNLYPPLAVRILKVWILVFAFVGTQMAWSLRPFVGSPGKPKFSVLREQEGNFYTGVWHSVQRLASKSEPQAD